jgi:hypothetical protein
VLDFVYRIPKGIEGSAAVRMRSRDRDAGITYFQKAQPVFSDEYDSAVTLPRFVENSGHLTLGHFFIGGVFNCLYVPAVIRRSNRADENRGRAVTGSTDFTQQRVCVQRMGNQSSAHSPTSDGGDHRNFVARAKKSCRIGVNMVYGNEWPGVKGMRARHLRNRGQNVCHTRAGVESQLCLIQSEAIGVRREKPDGDEHRSTASRLIGAGQFPFRGFVKLDRRNDGPQFLGGLEDRDRTRRHLDRRSGARVACHPCFSAANLESSEAPHLDVFLVLE